MSSSPPTPAEAAVRILEMDNDGKLWPLEALPFAYYRDFAPILAKEVQRLQALQVPRDTRKGQWPDEGQHIHVWWCYEWTPMVYRKASSNAHQLELRCLWFPAPPFQEAKSEL